MRRTIETDICIIGSGITAAMVAEGLTRGDHPRRDILVLEAGDDVPPLGARYALRARDLAYGENPWPDDHLEGYDVEGPLQSRSMCVGGLAMHWGGVTPRFSPEDFHVRSLFGVGHDWPISYEDLEPHYQEAEELLGVAGKQGPSAMDPRARPFPMPALPLTYNLELLKGWVEKAGITMWSQPSAKNSVAYGGRAQCCRNDTCAPICPIGAKYSPDFTWNALRAAKKLQLKTRTLVRRLVLAHGTSRVSHAVAVERDRPGDPLEIHARQFVVAGGYVWSAHLLLLSAQDGAPNGLANQSGLVGKYLAGHRNVQAFVALPLRLYPGINEQHSLVTKQFMRVSPSDTDGKYVRHDLRVWESAFGRGARLTNDQGDLLLGDEILRDWRNRTQTGVARVRAYYDVIPDRTSELTLDTRRRSAWGDPLPKLTFRDDPVSRDLRPHTEERIRILFEHMARAGDGTVLRTNVDEFQDHPAGGCRMGADPGRSVVDSYGRAHDHENLWIVGAPTSVSGGCANATLTFCALALRSAAQLAHSRPTRSTQTDAI